jgi:hypothetical protein
MSSHILTRRSRARFTVYVIEAPGTGMAKIGITGDLEGRFRNLTDGSPVPLTILYSFDGRARDEAALHWRFLADRSHGEWFRVTDEMRAFVERLRSLDREQHMRVMRGLRVGKIPKPRARPVGTPRDDLAFRRRKRDEQRARAQRLLAGLESLFAARAA